MRRSLLFLAAAAVAVLVVAIPVNPQGLRVGQFSGTFRHWAHFGTGLKYPGFVNIYPDGSLTVSGGKGIHGVWERTSVRNIHATSFFSNFDDPNNLYIERHRCSLDYSADFNSYQGTEFAETVGCPTPLSCPDPLDPNTVWTRAPWSPPNGFPISGNRVGLVAPGPLP